jgi:hypothetical protein
MPHSIAPYTQFILPVANIVTGIFHCVLSKLHLYNLLFSYSVFTHAKQLFTQTILNATSSLANMLIASASFSQNVQGIFFDIHLEDKTKETNFKLSTEVTATESHTDLVSLQRNNYNNDVPGFSHFLLESFSKFY